ncbi:hypothetical protein LP7551_02847 [Roseibium album]|nr:hypothetical protein LP7551_02847 [Roseibium album]
MPTNIYTLPSNLTAVHVIGVTPADHHRLSGSKIPGYHEADLVGHPQQAFTQRGKIRPTVYFANGSRFTQSHVNDDNIGYHPPSGQHLFFGNVDRAEYRRARTDPRLFKQQLRSYVDGTVQPCTPLPPRLGEAFEGRMLLEIYKGIIHPSRSALVAVSYQQAVELVRSIHGRSAEKLQYQSTGEWYFGQKIEAE